MATPIEIPSVLLKKFKKEPRFIIDIAAPGYWPVEMKYLRDSKFFQELFEDRDFAKTHQVVIMKK